MNNFSLGDRLRALRKERGLSQEQLAHQANITPAFLGQVERGTKGITVRTLEKVCGILHVPLSEFFTDLVDRNDDPTLTQIAYLLHDRSDKDKKTILDIIRLACSLPND